MNDNQNTSSKIRNDFLKDIVSQLVKRRQFLMLTQDELNHRIGVADRLVSKWECGDRSPTAFNLYCWCDALEGHLMFVPNYPEPGNDNKDKSEPEKVA